ncbi:hypothetical protein ACSLBF_04505 [Pseudoalteromonas sp. T1lg65]|uniref:hypothetical protein n=1 Tax=Pseudoalteromonas sp. T1lg65 TaxID=2077101 RepID=UPI003F792D29
MALKHAALVVAVGCALNSQTLLAADNIHLSGFASIRATLSDSDGGEAPFEDFKGHDDVTFSDESLMALQARSDLGDGLSATIQLMAEGKKDFDVDARWAYISYEISPQHTVSAGRLANPSFYHSEYQKVGYTHNYGRLPRSVYIGFDFTTIQGITLDSSFVFGEYTLLTKVLYGSWEGTTYLSATGQDESFGLQDELSIRAELSKDWWAVYGGIFRVKIKGGTVDTNALVGAAQPGIAAARARGATDQQVDDLIQAIKWGGKTGLYAYMGFHIDYMKFIIDAEYADYGVDESSDGFNNAWYSSVGYRINDKVILSVRHEKYLQDNDDLSFLNNVKHPILYATGKAIRNSLSFREFNGVGITLRYDFHPNAAFKIDYFDGEDTRPTVGDYRIWSAGIDIVF